MNTRHLLIFGCGYLGRPIAQQWLARGGRVSALTRGHGEDLARLGITPIVGDVTDPATLGNLPEADAVVYAVGFDRSSGRAFRDVYVAGLGHVLAALPSGGRFVYVSSTGVYGQQDGGLVDESSPAEPVDDSGRVVLEAENLLRASRPESLILRFAGIYGPGRLLRADALRAGEPLAADPTKWLNLIHVDDGATAVLAALDRAADGRTYNVADRRPVTRGDYYRRLAELIDAPPPNFVPPPADAPPGRHDRTNRRISNQALLRDLQVTLRYPSYVEGLADAVNRSSASR